MIFVFVSFSGFFLGFFLLISAIQLCLEIIERAAPKIETTFSYIVSFRKEVPSTQKSKNDLFFSWLHNFYGDANETEITTILDASLTRI